MAAKQASSYRGETERRREFRDELQRRSVVEAQTVLEIRDKQLRNRQKQAAREAKKLQDVMHKTKKAAADAMQTNLKRVRLRSARIKAQIPHQEAFLQAKVDRVRMEQAVWEQRQRDQEAAKQSQSSRVKQQQQEQLAQQRQREQEQQAELRDRLDRRRAHTQLSGSLREAKDLAEYEKQALLYQQMQYKFANPVV